MLHKNCVFHSILKWVPWHVFDRQVAEHGADRRVRRLRTHDQFVALLYGQLSGAASLRDVVGGLKSHGTRLYHLGARPVERSTLADANARRPPAVFSGVFSALVSQAQRGLRRKAGEAVYLIDATGLHLAGGGAEWARFSDKVCGAKAHVIYDADADQPIYAAVTPAKVNDITAAREMPIEAGATYVYDLGYYDYAWWAKLAAAGCRIVTRFKTSTPLAVTAELPVPETDDNILSDRIGLLPRRQARNRENPFGDPVREISVRIETGKVLRILSNDLDAPAREIADLYKRRWAIELFFRWVKQTLKIRHFLGTNENAVRIQIAVALIAFLLLKIAQAAQKTVHRPIDFARLVRINLMHRRPIENLTGDDPPPPPKDTRQMMLQWNAA